MKYLLAAAALACAAQTAHAAPIDRWSDTIAEASSRFAIPPDWIRGVMRAESDGRTMARGRPIVSRAGAMGLMQLMPGTWSDMRRLLGLGPDPFDPHDNILAGAAYLRLMYDRFGYPGLFAAYNAGPARYSSTLNGKGALPAETRAYAAKLGAATGPPTRLSANSDGRSAPGLFAVANVRDRPGGQDGRPASLRSAFLFIQLTAENP
jgi:soluble lytic murein transglycosylase-like protein